ncbi:MULTISPECIES: HD-GYP domain-containing protein [Brevibacillus]|uniref:HD domain-containing protein n=1 Tax=Brevibacillus porteri TaxID=2126350 RepID=A0ABX5FJE7_9BACL|nr:MULTISPECIES: HD domain-containing phosphohydrolase [Brevibacillus]MDC0760145.1 HD domain-containing protein [Brevibacillus sp. AG]MED1802960.1 HD domain-containing phosphohydrolase [Brevibacillus porteri]MED2134680.1 HD domain-containing phosphohydrolase [Brevibacillus porteri]MED2748141.1 HD domain-containing phosphohydrolase [Brevibacillus porteri]MED2817464.1 HD domain-containing phosphohydrolase [Brevibacillus porteri]
MRKLHITSVKPGDVIAKSVFQENGNVLLGIGVQLTPRYIERLVQLGIDTLYIQDKHTEDIMPEDVIRDETRKEAVDAVYKTMTTLMDQPQIKRRTSVPDFGSSFQKVFREIFQDLSSRKDILVNLSSLHVLDGYLFHHAVNVAVLSGVVGMAKGYNQQQMMELGIGALLFDIGMTQVPKELWTMRTELSAEERQRVQYHTEEGFNILRNQHNISVVSAHCALQHHERYNGTGYPRQLCEKNIHEYARIVAIADVYDALVSPRPFRKSYSPSDATEYLFATGNTYFDLDLLKLFLQHVAIYPIASTVMLSTGHTGVVSKVNPLAVNRPTIRILTNEDGSEVASTYEVDLYDKEWMSVTIVKTL